MKVNIEANKNGIIVQWKSYPLDETMAVEVKDPYSIHLGVDKFIDGKIVKDNKTYKKALERVEKQARIEELKQLLKDSDYKLFKYLEGELSEEEFSTYKAERQSWRNEINQLEEEL